MEIFDIFHFLKYCLGNEVNMSAVASRMDWRQLYAFAKKQALLGFCFQGIERLGNEYPEELKRNPIGQDLLMEWMGKAQQIRRRNMKVNQVASKLYSQLRKDGLRCCVLKGQGNALMYAEPYSRTPGDIDVWVNAERKDVFEYAQKHFTLGDDMRYHHLETAVDGVPVELHFMPCVMNNVVYNRRLQKWFKRNADLQCSNVVELPDEAGEIAVPTTAFNVIYQLCHLYHHFFDEGIGMRQIIDYYFVVNDLFSFESRLKFLAKNNFSKTHPSSLTLKGGSTAFPKPLFNSLYDPFDSPCRGQKPQGTGDVAGDAIALPEIWSASEAFAHKGLAGEPTQQSCDCLCGVNRLAASSLATDDTMIVTDELEALRRELKYLGLLKFAGAVMFVLHEVLGLAEDKMIVPMDEMRGRLLLSEILNGGNFGKHFSKYGHFTQQGMAKKYFLKIWRNMHFVGYYPAEALSEPVFRTWHFLWRKWNKR